MNDSSLLYKAECRMIDLGIEISGDQYQMDIRGTNNRLIIKKLVQLGFTENTYGGWTKQTDEAMKLSEQAEIKIKIYRASFPSVFC